jgi:hypothetical protein
MEEQNNVTVETETETENEKVNNVRPYSESEFLSDLEWTKKLYLAVVIVSFALAAASIGVAVIWKVSYGLVGAFATVVFYLNATSHILYTKLGFSHTSERGELTVTEIYGKNREEVFVPERLLWLDVTSIGKEACDHKSSAEIKVLHLPRTLKTIEIDAFKGVRGLERICYGGSEEEWSEVEILCELENIEICFNDAIDYPVKERKDKKDKKDKKAKKHKKTAESEGTDSAEEETE